MEIKNIKTLKKQLDEMNVDEIIRGEVKEFGTSAHLNIPKKHLGKKTITLILKK
jgi:putative transposon-encoded protein